MRPKMVVALMKGPAIPPLRAIKTVATEMIPMAMTRITLAKVMAFPAATTRTVAAGEALQAISPVVAATVGVAMPAAVTLTVIAVVVITEVAVEGARAVAKVTTEGRVDRNG
jgi:hypothetical protein